MVMSEESSTIIQAIVFIRKVGQSVFYNQGGEIKLLLNIVYCKSSFLDPF